MEVGGLALNGGDIGGGGGKEVGPGVEVGNALLQGEAWGGTFCRRNIKLANASII